MENAEIMAMIKNLGAAQTRQLPVYLILLTIMHSCSRRFAEQKGQVRRSQKWLDLMEYECVVTRRDRSEEGELAINNTNNRIDHSRHCSSVHSQ